MILEFVCCIITMHVLLQVAAEPLLCSQTGGRKEEGMLTCMCTLNISLGVPLSLHSWLPLLAYFPHFLGIRETVAGGEGTLLHNLLVPISLSSVIDTLVHVATIQLDHLKLESCSHSIITRLSPIPLSLASVPDHTIS